MIPISALATQLPLRRPCPAQIALKVSAGLPFALAFLLTPLFAQQPQSQPAPPSAPQSTAPASNPASTPQPDARTQIQTGFTSGLTLDQRLQNLLADHQYSRVAAQLGQLPADQAQFYRGLLATAPTSSRNPSSCLSR